MMYKTKDFEDDMALNLLETVSAFIDLMGRWTEVYIVKNFILDKKASLGGEEHPITIAAMRVARSTQVCIE